MTPTVGDYGLMPETNPAAGEPAQERRPARIAQFWEESLPLVLIADPLADEPAVLSEHCRNHGIRTALELSGASALIAFGRTRPDAVIVSERLTDVPWQVIARSIAADSGGRVPVLLALQEGGTATEEPLASRDVVETLDSYADARSSPVLTRLAKRSNGPSRRDAELTYGSLIMRPAAFEVRDNGTPIPLTLREFELLRVLILAGGEVVGHDQLKTDVWGVVGESVSTDTVQVHMARLRQKLTGTVRPIAVRGIGYRLAIQ